ncbi:hypothetical protein PVAP13_3KG122945 [Panicum virgatum]|uniref:Uncharacterized protein n=1 Tax=Panicum virgatum TaxID=38727 RepID=A0A8T0USB4_PANVG|nr:hypothetical protein PVAP13_3KG122945 [Panicum virgatum]
MGAPAQLFGAWQSSRHEHDTTSHPHSEPQFSADNSTSLLRPLANLAFGHQEATLAAENQWSDGGRAGKGEATVKIPKCRVQGPKEKKSMNMICFHSISSKH